MQENDIRIRPIMRSWYKYKFFVAKAMCGNAISGENGIIYWRERLFTDFITYLLPVCTLALVPGVYMGITSGHFFIAVFDIVVVCSVAIVALSKELPLVFRKAFVIGILYCLAIVLIVNLGSMGPGNIYLFAISFIVTLTFPIATAYWSIAINALICSGFAVIIYLHLFDIPLIHEYTIGSFIAVFANLIFLNWVSVQLISNTIDGLEQIISKEFQLKDELQKEVARRIRSSQRLKDSDDHYRSLFMLNPSPMWVLDNQTQQFLQVNEAAIKNYGYTNEEFLSLTLKDIKLEEDMEAVPKDMRKSAETGIPVHITTRHRRKNQEQFHVEVVFNTIPYNGKKASLVIVQDISERINYTKAIESQNKKLREIAHIQSHHVRAPLARVLGFVNLISDDENGKTDPELLCYLNESAKELDDIIREITKNAESLP